MMSILSHEQPIIEKIRDTKNTQKDIAMHYAALIKSLIKKDKDPASPRAINWSQINRAILDRWSEAGLTNVKQIAWNIVEGRGSNAPG